jgi:predicted nucleic acid-binding protein
MICVDASVAIKLILDEERSDCAIALYEATVDADERIVAPPLSPIEVINILRQRMRGEDGFSLARAIVHLDDFLALPVAIHNPPGIHRRAIALADAYGLPAAYDAHYVALAEHFGCDFWTDDQRLLRLLANDLPFVRALREYTPTAEM